MTWITKLFSKIPNVSGFFSKALLGAFVLLLGVSLFQNWQIKSLNTTVSEAQTKQAVLEEKKNTLLKDITDLGKELEKKTEASIYWREQNTQLEKRNLELEEMYDEAIKKAPKETQECLSTPLPDDVFHSLTGM